MRHTFQGKRDEKLQQHMNQYNSEFGSDVIINGDDELTSRQNGEVVVKRLIEKAENQLAQDIINNR